MDELSVVTGGTSGIGFAVAQDLVRDYDLALVYKSNETRAHEAVERLGQLNSTRKIRAFRGHLGDPKEAARVFLEIENWHSRTPTNLINCAGQSYISFLVTDTPETMAAPMENNFFSTLYATHFVARKMFVARAGRIVNISSTAGDRDLDGYALYAAAKAAIEAFTKGTSRELFKRGVTINCVRPGLIRTAMTEGLLKVLSDSELTPIEAVVTAIRYFLNPDAARISGQILTVDR